MSEASFALVDDHTDGAAAQPRPHTAYFSPSNLPSWPASVAGPPSVSDVGTSNMAQLLAEQLAEQDVDATAFEHCENFNLLCVGESGLGKSTFLRDIFAHLDPTKQQEMKRRVAEQAKEVNDLKDRIDRNEKESRQCDDKRSLELRAEKKELRAAMSAAIMKLEAVRQEKRQMEEAVHELRGEIQALDETLQRLRGQRDAEEDDEEAERLGHEVVAKQAELVGKRETLAAELYNALHRSNGERERGATEPGAQTKEVTSRLIKGMPLFDGASRGLDVTLIDTPGYGDLLVDTHPHRSADKVCAEVEQRIAAHLAKDRATRAGMPLDDEKKFWNELVHLCLFFISPHRMKRADVELMRRLHTLVPLVVVIAKSDTMTRAETLDFKESVRKQLFGPNGVQTFTFDAALIKDVEARHTANAPDGFQPLYGGSDGRWPWAVMGSDESRREYIWGTCLTNEPHHSEMPALRDLLLRAGGWEHLKRDAALKADAEGVRRADAARGSGPLAPGHRRWRRRGALGALLVAAVAALGALGGGLGGGPEPPPPPPPTIDPLLSRERHVAELERQLQAARDDLAQCTDVRRALDDDLRALHNKLKPLKKGYFSW